MDRLYTDTVGSDDEAAIEAVRWLLRYATDQAADRAAIVVPSVDSASNLSGLLGQEDSSRLIADRAMPAGALRLELFTMKTLPNASYPGPVLVLWGDRKGVEKVERMDPTAVCAVQWTEGELTDWARTWGATELRSGRSELRPAVPELVRGAVFSLSAAGDVAHPGDKQRTVWTLKAMRLVDVPIDPEALRAEALRQGWSATGADRLRELAAKVAEGRTVRGGGKVTKTEARKAAARWKAAGADVPTADQGE